MPHGSPTSSTAATRPPRFRRRPTRTVEGQLADRATVDEALAPAAEQDAWSGFSADWYAGMSSTERWVAEREYADMQQRTAYTREQLREHTWAQ